MSLMRAFTNRRFKPQNDLAANIHLGRAASQRGGKPVPRSQISGPVALVSTTNMLSYEAPDIPGAFPHDGNSSASSSDEETDASTLSIDTSGNVTDASSVDMSPVSSEPEPNHLSCYFKPAVDTKAISRSPSVLSKASFDAPAIPKRIPSHSKKAHEHIHRKRSVQRMMSPPASIRSSTDMFSPPRSTFADAPGESPFGNELTQLDEVSEEGVRDAESNVDAAFLDSHSLACFSASEYLSEIQELIYTTFASDEPTWL